MDDKELKEYLSLLEVATYFYIDGLSQKDIAKKLYYSTAKVSRMLKKILDRNIVEIKLNYPDIRCSEFEEKIKNKFNLSEVVVTTNVANNNQTDVFGYYTYCAQYLSNILCSGMNVAVSSGSSVNSVLGRLLIDYEKKLKLIAPKGMANRDNKIDFDCSTNIELLAAKYTNSERELLYSPLYVKNKIVRDYLIDEPIIKNVMSIYDDIDVLITSVGDFLHKGSQVWAGFMDDSHYRQLLNQGIVASFLGHFINKNGIAVYPYDWTFPIGMSIEQISSCKNTVLLVNGSHKCESALAVLKSGLINTLICDYYIGEYLFNS